MVMEDEGPSSNRGEQVALPEATEAIATSSTSSSSSESGKISGLDWSASSRESGSTSSTSSSDESKNSGGGSYVKLMLSVTDAGKRDADMEEGEIGKDADAAIEEAAEGSGENLAGVKADLRDLVKARTCFIGRSLMTQADLDALRLEGCFEPGICRLPGNETTQKPRKNESVVFRDFFTAGLHLLTSKRFVDILAAYNVQIHQLTPNSIPQVLKFLWAYRTFAGDNDVETFVRHFKIHWARKIITVDDEEKEAQYGCCTFQTRLPGKNQAPVELAPAYKNKWANRWTSYWFYSPIVVVGQNSK
jgi:hypothetical protein